MTICKCSVTFGMNNMNRTGHRLTLCNEAVTGLLECKLQRKGKTMNPKITLDYQINRLGFWSAMLLIASGVVSIV